MTSSWPAGRDNLPTTYGAGQAIPHVGWNNLSAALNALETPAYTIQPPGWNTAWVAAKAALATTPAWFGIYGDSIFQGFYASNMMTGSAESLVIAGLKARYPTNYAEFWPLADSVFLAPGFTPTPPWVVNDTTHAVQVLMGPGPVNGVRWAGDAHPAATLATFITPVACTAVEIVFMSRYTGAGATWTYTIDGGATQTYTTLASADVIRKITVSGLSSAVHTIVFTGQSVDNTFVLVGISCYPAGTGGVGLGYARGSLQGASASLFTTGGLPANLTHELLGGKLGCVPSPFGFPTAPALAIIPLGVNDCGAAVALTTFSNALNRACESLRYGYDHCSIVFVIPANPSVSSSDIVANNVANEDNFGQYAEVIDTIAGRQNCAVVDMRAKWGSRPVAGGWLDATGHGPHPIDAGHVDIANTVLSIL